MKCPQCESRKNHVVDSRETPNGYAIRRRRLCIDCNHRFTTYEESQRTQLKVTKRDGHQEEFIRKKLVNSLCIACRKRPIDSEQIEHVTDSIVTEVKAEFKKEIPSGMLGIKAMAVLEQLDQAAYIRYVSVHHRFCNAVQFINEAERLLGRK